MSRVTGSSIAPDGRVSLAGGRYRAIVPLVDSASGTAWLASRREAEAPTAVVKICSPRFADYLGGAADRLVALAREADPGLADVPGLPALLAVIEDDDMLAFVFEPVHGEPLDQLMPSFPDGLPLAVARAAISRLAGALAALHARRIMHLDLRPATIAMDAVTHASGLFDWGHAVPAERVVSDEARLPGFDAQGVQYASLELLTGRPPHPADDVFAFGCVAYEMLTGRHPFGRRTASEAASLGLEPDLVPGLSRHEQSLLRRALALHGTRRDVTMAQIADAFSPGDDPDLPTSARGQRAVLAVAAIALACTVAWVAWQHLSTPPAATVQTEVPAPAR